MAIISSKQKSEQPQDQPPKNRGVRERKNIPKAAAKPEILQPVATADEEGKQEESIRPQRLADYIGQKDLKGVLEIAIAASKARGESLDHLLLYGSSWFGQNHDVADFSDRNGSKLQDYFCSCLRTTS